MARVTISALPVRSVVFDEPSLVSKAGLVPAMGLAARAGLVELADRQLTVPGGAGHPAGLKVSALVAGMVGGADSIADMGVLRHAGMGRLFSGVRVPSTLGTFMRGFRFGHGPIPTAPPPESSRARPTTRRRISRGASGLRLTHLHGYRGWSLPPDRGLRRAGADLLAEKDLRLPARAV